MRCWTSPKKDTSTRMMIITILLAMLAPYALGAPRLRIMPEPLLPPQLLTLPSNATSIRTDISDSFHCEGREYGYYADVENDCQLFHVCLPVTYSDGRNQTFRWSFICPEDTVFNQEMFTCTRSDESIDCAESPRYYELNRKFGSPEDVGQETEPTDVGSYLEAATPVPAEILQAIGRSFTRRGKISESKKSS